MPIYEYKCKNCGHIFDELKWKDDETYCPRCHEYSHRSWVMPLVSFNARELKEQREGNNR